MKRVSLIALTYFFSFPLFSQELATARFISDTALKHASVSVCIADALTGETVYEHNSSVSSVPASVMKLITTAVAIEMLGPDYTFTTHIGFSGKIDTLSKVLSGNIIIKGGGDPSLGSVNFSENYNDFLRSWVNEIKKLGIKKIEGSVISDDSYYDYRPTPSKWLWEDIGNYYGAGAYGLSVFDNLYEIHLKSTSGSPAPVIKEIIPAEYEPEILNHLRASGTADYGNIFSSPYGTSATMEGIIPAGQNDFVLKASISDPPLLLAKIMTKMLNSAGITLTEEPSTARLVKNYNPDDFSLITETVSPPLSKIIEVLNHESVNLYAEHLLKELGKKYGTAGSTYAGIEVVMSFLRKNGIDNSGLYMEDGSGLSPLDAINTRLLSNVLSYMETSGKYFGDYFSSLPEAGKNGTIKYHFTDPIFDNRLRAKSGSMTRVRNYAGYLTTIKGNKLVFSIIVNNFSGSSGQIVAGVENILRQTIINK